MSRERVRRILVVEDEDPIRELIALRVDLAGHHAIAVKNGLEALHAINQRMPDAMILDIGLPAMDGFEILHAIQHNGWTIPTLMLTARHAAQDVKQAIDLGARDYLTKPFDGKMFLQKLERLLQPAPPKGAVHCL